MVQEHRTDFWIFVRTNFGGAINNARLAVLVNDTSGLPNTGPLPRLLSDNRIPAFGSDTGTCTFPAPAAGKISLSVYLLYRRAFILRTEVKSWGVPDIVMEKQGLEIP